MLEISVRPTRRCKPIHQSGLASTRCRCGRPANSNQRVRSNRRKTNTLTSVRCVGLAANAPVVTDALCWIYNLVAIGTALQLLLLLLLLWCRRLIRSRTTSSSLNLSQQQRHGRRQLRHTLRDSCPLGCPLRGQSWPHTTGHSRCRCRHRRPRYRRPRRYNLSNLSVCTIWNSTLSCVFFSNRPHLVTTCGWCGPIWTVSCTDFNTYMDRIDPVMAFKLDRIVHMPWLDAFMSAFVYSKFERNSVILYVFQWEFIGLIFAKNSDRKQPIRAQQIQLLKSLEISVRNYCDFFAAARGLGRNT